MPATRVHLVRHGEVHNPGGVLYGRLPHFSLSENGRLMARSAAEALKLMDVKLAKLVASPLQRTQESAEPISELFGVTAQLDERVIEPYNFFEGRRVSLGAIALRPQLLFHLRNPFQPSWGEPYLDVVARMKEAMIDAVGSVESGDVVIVSHQLPIWAMHLHLAGQKLAHNPSNRRCALSSITSFDFVDGTFSEIGYLDPAANLERLDRGAV